MDYRFRHWIDCIVDSMTVPVQALELYHPMGLTEDWADKMQGQNFYSKNQRTTFEHYMQVRPEHSQCDCIICLASLTRGWYRTQACSSLTRHACVLPEQLTERF